jgi:hypothetical protein
MDLLRNQTGNTDGSQPFMEGSGASILVQVEGVFDGCIFGIEGSLGNLEWQSLRDTSGAIVMLTSPSTIIIAYAKAGLRIRASVISAGASTDVTAVAAN